MILKYSLNDTDYSTVVLHTHTGHHSKTCTFSLDTTGCYTRHNTGYYLIILKFSLIVTNCIILKTKCCRYLMAPI